MKMDVYFFEKMKYTLLAGFLVLLIISGCNPGLIDRKDDNGISKSDTLNSMLETLNQKIASDKNNSSAYHERALYYLEKEDYTNAFKDITSAIEIDSTITDYQITLADTYIGMGKLQKGVEVLEQAVERDDQSMDAYLKLAEISIVFRDYKNALNYTDKALKLDDLESKGYFLRGVVFLENGDTLRSIRNFQRAAEYNQQYFDAFLQLGVIFSKKNNDLAIDYFNNALNIRPDDTETMYYLAMYYQNTGKYEEAIQVYNSLLVKDPQFYFAIYNIAYINLVYLKNFQEAIDFFTQTIEINPEYADAYYNRGFAYEMLKDVENSRTDYKKTLEIKANYEKAIEGLNRIDEYLENQR
jgi:tetratricopeptide (TPR) repeat protein